MAKRKKKNRPYRGNPAKMAECPICHNRIVVRAGRYGRHAKAGMPFCANSGQRVLELK
jgi:transcription elongation factor Elf1